MFALSKRAGALADRLGPRLFMGAGPLLAAAGLLLLLRVDARADYATELLPALLAFSIGLAATVAPLTATVLSDAEEGHAGIASGVNNVIARAAGLLGVAALGAVVAAQVAGGLRKRLDVSSLSPAGRAVVAATEDRALARADVSGLAADEASAIARASEAAAVSAFHVGTGISASARPSRSPSPADASAAAAPRTALFSRPWRRITRTIRSASCLRD